MFLFGFSSPEDSCFGLRWFTPASEVPLCGHATLASAAVLFYKISNVIISYEPIILQIANIFKKFSQILSDESVTGIKTLQNLFHAIHYTETKTAPKTLAFLNMSQACWKAMVSVP